MSSPPRPRRRAAPRSPAARGCVLRLLRARRGGRRRRRRAWLGCHGARAWRPASRGHRGRRGLCRRALRSRAARAARGPAARGDGACPAGAPGGGDRQRLRPRPPRRAGLALRLGAVLDLPSVGVTDRPLLAAGAQPAPERRATSPLLLDGAEVARAPRPRRGRADAAPRALQSSMRKPILRVTWWCATRPSSPICPGSRPPRTNQGAAVSPRLWRSTLAMASVTPTGDDPVISTEL